MNGFLDRLPAPVRHFVLVFFGAAATTLLGVVVAAVHGDGLASIQWGTALLDSLGAGIAAGAAAVGVAAGTPIITQYGVGAASTDPTGGVA